MGDGRCYQSLSKAPTAGRFDALNKQLGLPVAFRASESAHLDSLCGQTYAAGALRRRRPVRRAPDTGVGEESMVREHYMSVEGPKGRATVYEVTGDAPIGGGNSWEPRYEVEFSGGVTRFNSEGEAITVAQQLTGAPDNY
jgi:hypothetical protein